MFYSPFTIMVIIDQVDDHQHKNVKQITKSFQYKCGVLNCYMHQERTNLTIVIDYEENDQHKKCTKKKEQT